jgi:hypothetical protein
VRRVRRSVTETSPADLSPRRGYRRA